MMRGMFAAISGLKQHQVMLDVTANDIANVNTIGYKSARVTFPDSLNQLQRGAAGANTDDGRLQRGAGRPRRRPRLDRQPDDRWRDPDDRQPARRRHPGRRVLPARRGRPGRRQLADQRRRPTPAPATSRSTTSGYLTTQTGKYVAGYALDGTGNPITTNVAIQIPQPAPPASRSTRRAASPGSTRCRRPASRRTASRWRRSRTPPASSARAATNGSPRPTRARRPPARRASTASAPRRPARSRCPTSTSRRRSRT